MLKNNNKFKKGFTIIEVVLVLAIAGLIFLMVFIALPALQSSQRNTQRESDVERFLSAVTDYSSNNSGRIPFKAGSTGRETTVVKFVTRYIDDTCSDENGDGKFEEDECTADQFRDPDGVLYNFEPAKVATLPTDGVYEVEMPEKNDHVIYFAVKYMCGAEEGTVIEGTGDRQVALLMTLEGGSVTCNANS